MVTDAEQRRAIADVYRRTWDLIVASPFAVADRFKDDPARNREQRKVSDSAAYLAEHFGEVPVLMIPCVELIDGDRMLTGENASKYWSSIMPATWSYMLAARSRGLGTTWTGVTIMADDAMRAILGLPDNVYHATTSPRPTTPARPSAVPNGFRSTTCCISTGGERPSEAGRRAGHPCASEISRSTTMDGDYDDPAPITPWAPANPSIPMTFAMTTRTSWSMPATAGSRSSSIRARAHQLAQSDHQLRHRCVGAAEVFDQSAL